MAFFFLKLYYVRLIMTDYHLGNHKSINSFVAEKLEEYREMGLSFETLFNLMFRETDNILYESSEGYRIRKTTYGQAKSHILQKAAFLQQITGSLPKNAVVGLYMENSLAWIEAFWAILAAGYRPLLMNLRIPQSLLEQAMQSCGCSTVISADRQFACQTIDPSELETAIDFDAAPVFGTEILVMSSGTTEHVKVCAYTAEEFYYQISDSYSIIRKCTQIKKHYHGELKLLAFLPFYHVFGLIAMYIWFAFFSRTFVHLADLSPQTIINTIKRHKVTHIFAVPLFWEKVYSEAIRGIRERGEKTWNKFNKAMTLWKKLPRPLANAFSKAAFREIRENLFGESICFMITGGSFLDQKILTFFNAIGYRLANGYGMTEIGITSVELTEQKKYLCGGYVGSPMSYAEYRLDPSGELLVRGNVLAKYILSDGKKTERGGWFHTNDLASCDHGHFRLLGRKDDLIVSSGGENLNPILIEALLRPASGAEICLIGKRTGEISDPVLLVSVNRFIPRQKLLALDSALKEKIFDAGLSSEIRRISYVEGPLLRPDEFKLNRVRLSREYSEGRIALVDPETRTEEAVVDELTARVRSCFAIALEKAEEELSQDADFFLDCGGSSLDYFAMLAKLRDEFGLAFPMEDSGLRTVRQITDYIRNDGRNGEQP